MATEKNRKKFLAHGRKAFAAKIAGVSSVTVSLWVRGLRPCEKLERLARMPVKDWRTYDAHR